MFDGVIKALKKLEDGLTIKVEIPCDSDRYLDRLCSGTDCGVRFKAMEEDWQNKESDKAWCPLCGRSADPSEYVTNEQVEYMHTVGGFEAQKLIHEGLKTSAKTYNRAEQRRRKSGPISVTTEISVNSQPPSAPITMDPWDAMKTKHVCEECDFRFAVVGAWFYCPACGMNDPQTTFRQSVRGVRNAMKQLAVLLEQADPDLAADLLRSNAESCIGGLVTAFQVVVEAIYGCVPSAPTARRNAFQNLNNGSELWVGVGGSSFESMMGTQEYSRTNLFFQRRHILQHCVGIVDQGYLNNSGDTTYRVGERLVTQRRDVLELADNIELLVNAINKEAEQHGWRRR